MPENTEKPGKAYISRVKEMGRRDASYLEHESLRVLIDDIGGFTPELSSVQDKKQLNAHWIPHFRSNSSNVYSDAENGAYWKSEHLYHLAGSFPCAPNFGTGHISAGITLPVNGWTANAKWTFTESGKDRETGAVWAVSTMESPDAKLPLSFRKVDALIPGQPVHYTSLKIINNGGKDEEICAGWQNIAGAPFLAPGCRVTASAKEWITAPVGSEFETTGILACGKEFISLTKAPLAAGGSIDMSLVPGPAGWTDFVTGAISKGAPLGWSAIVNPTLKMVYLTFFPGPAAAEENNNIPLYFNSIFMQYGGRTSSPWSLYEGGTDLSYCLGLAGVSAAWTSGLEYSQSEKKLLGSPTTITIPAKSEKTLYYGTLFAPYENNILDSGVVGIDGEQGFLVCKSAAESWRFKADPTFEMIKKL